MTTALALQLEDTIMSTARGLARRHELIDDTGLIWCWFCDKRPALLPSLHCPSCLAAAWGRIPVVMPQCINREQTDADREVMRGAP